MRSGRRRPCRRARLLRWSLRCCILRARRRRMAQGGGVGASSVSRCTVSSGFPMHRPGRRPGTRGRCSTPHAPARERASLKREQAGLSPSRQLRYAFRASRTPRSDRVRPTSQLDESDRTHCQDRSESDTPDNPKPRDRPRCPDPEGSAKRLDRTADEPAHGQSPRPGAHLHVVRDRRVGSFEQVPMPAI